MATKNEKRAIVIALENHLNNDDDDAPPLDYKKIYVEVGPNGNQNGPIVGFDTTNIFNTQTSEKDKSFHAHSTKPIQNKGWSWKGSAKDRNMRRIDLIIRYMTEKEFFWHIEGDHKTGIISFTLQKPPKFLAKNHDKIISDLAMILKHATGPITFNVRS